VELSAFGVSCKDHIVVNKRSLKYYCVSLHTLTNDLVTDDDDENIDDMVEFLRDDDGTVGFDDVSRENWREKNPDSCFFYF